MDGSVLPCVQMEAQWYQAGMTASGGLEELQDGGAWKDIFFNHHSFTIASSGNTAFSVLNGFDMLFFDKLSQFQW